MSRKQFQAIERQTLVDKLSAALNEIGDAPPTDKAAIRKEVRRLAQLAAGLRTLAKSRLSHLSSVQAGRERLLAYLKLFPGEIIEGTELQVVSGIQEFARRVRELRIEFGYDISTGTSREDLRPDQYVLESMHPDQESAEKWKVANQIRKRSGDARDRILALLKAFLGKPVTGEQIAYVAKIREGARRIRELRTEQGWRIVTKYTGRPDLPSGSYVLESDEQLPEHDRNIPDVVYDQVLERDDYSCFKCGWNINSRNPSGRRQFLEVHHVIFHHKGGTNDAENLVTLCNVHHDEVHRLKVEGAGLRKWLKVANYKR